MKLIANIKLLPTREQDKALRETLERCNQACDWLSGKAWEAVKFQQFALHKITYAECRETFGLAAQVAIRCIAKTADAYKLDRKRKRHFRKHSAQPYDDRIFRFVSGDAVSIWTLAGRIKIPFVCGERQRALLAYRKGEVDLMFVKGKWYLACVCDVTDPEEIGIEDVLGVDLGVVNLAFDSNGTSYTGSEVERVRSKLAKRKASLQRKGTKAAKRRLKKMAGKQARFQKHTNHCISKALVSEAQRLHAAIALEDLKGIRSRVKARRKQRARLHNWAFSQLRIFVGYKAKLAGIPVVFVDPRYTSKGCRMCGTIDDKNRPNQATFSCVACGHTEQADQHAARNIRARATVTMPVGFQAAKAA
jgi:IS605 OrfB family transposase